MINTLKKQFGFTILLLTILLLVISTILVFFTTQYSSLQQKIISNYYKNQQALEAAQAGIEVAIPYFQSNYSAIVANQSGGYLLPYVNSSTQNVALSNGSTYTFVFSNPTANNFQLITITSTGRNADGTATRTAIQQIQAYTSGPLPPTVSIATQGDIRLTDNATFSNIQSNSNINAGGDITFNDIARTVISSGTGSSAAGLGSDVQEFNSSISSLSTDQFLTNQLGVTQGTLQGAANYTYTNSSDTNYNSTLNGKTNSVIWINNEGSNTATVNGNTIIGSPTSPVILVINGGQFKLANNATVYGLVIILNSSASSTEKMKDNATVVGAVMTTDDITFKDNSRIVFSNTVLNALPNAGGAPSYAKLPASWRDF